MKKGGGWGGILGSTLESDAVQLQLKTNFIFLVKYFLFSNVDMPNLCFNLIYNLDLHNKF